MSSALEPAALLALLHAGERVLLPSARAAKAWRERFDAAQCAHGLRAWKLPPVGSWSEWTDSLWSTLTLEGRDERVLLNRLQEERLWVEVILNSPEGVSLTPSAARELAALARSGLALAAGHNALSRVRVSADSPDTKAFANWQALFLQACANGRLLPRALLETALSEHLGARTLTVTGSVHLAGFDRFTPAQELLLDTLRPAGCAVLSHALVRPAPSVPLRGTVLTAAPRDDLRWAACWTRERLKQAGDASCTVALLLPDPASERTQLDPVLREVLAPELTAIEADLSSRPWEFGTGPALASLSLVQHAMLLLNWVQADLPLESVGALLLSPFLAHGDELEARARFEMHALRRAPLLRPELSLGALLQLAQRPQSRLQLPGLQALRQLAGAPGTLSGNGSHADWTELIRKLLRSVGWPGPRTLSAAEFRATEAWESVLDLIATLDFTGRRVSFADVIGLLKHELENTPAPEAAAGAPLQILRLAEAEGCLFDSVLLLHATDSNLPLPEQVHPLLAWELQRSLGLPGSDPALTHARSRDTIRGLAGRCGDLLFVSAITDENGPLRASPLAAALRLEPLDPDLLVPWIAPQTPLEPDLVPDASPLPPLPAVQVSGGARILELQAACGFRAFAELRLGAGKPEAGTLGLDPRESGNVLHTALEFFWTETQTQKALRAFSTEQRNEQIRRSVHHGFGRLREGISPGDRWANAYLDILQRRLRLLLDRWLDLELQRGNFTVLPPEQKQTVHVGPLELSVRPDRIDSVDGGFVLVDYKTSSALSTGDWLGDRPEAPQLPLYALLGETPEFRGLAFARLRPGKAMAWLSLEDRPGLFQPKRGGALHDIAGQIELWRTELDRLASDFAAGRTEVHPKTYPSTCQYCQQRLLCRLDAATLLTNAPAGTETDTEKPHG